MPSLTRVVFNRKGGVGKSTIVCNLAAIDALAGRPTLVVDLDSQANASQYLLGAGWKERPPGTPELFGTALGFSIRSTDPSQFVSETPFDGLAVMAAGPELSELQSKLETRHKIYKLREALQKLSEQYERIYIDTPPALNFYTVSALIAADRCLIPFDCDDFSRQAIYALMQNVDEVRDDHNAQLEVEGIVVNQYQSRSRLPQEIVESLIAEGLPVLPVYLSASVKVRESHGAARPLPFLEPRHKLNQEFVALHQYLESRKRRRKA